MTALLAKSSFQLPPCPATHTTLLRLLAVPCVSFRISSDPSNLPPSLSATLQSKLPTMSHEERFIPERQKLDQLGVVKDYAVHPRLDYR